MSGGSSRGTPLELRERAADGRRDPRQHDSSGQRREAMPVYLVLAARRRCVSGRARRRSMLARPGTTTEELLS